MLKWARIAAFAAWVALTALASGCATNPVTGKSQFSLVSGQQELAIGKDGYQAMLTEYGAYEDPRVTAYVDSVGKKLAAVSHLPNLDWHFTVLDDPVVNAFAMPGGYIYISRGILAHLNSEAQLAGVLGHEIGHVTARHTAAQITKQQIAGLTLGSPRRFLGISSVTVARRSRRWVCCSSSTRATTRPRPTSWVWATPPRRGTTRVKFR